jgi:hypothetical protein
MRPEAARRKVMSKQMSRDDFDAMTAQERSEFIRAGGTLYDGDKPPQPKQPVKPEYLISRKLYNSLTPGQEQVLNEKHTVVIID